MKLTKRLKRAWDALKGKSEYFCFDGNDDIIDVEKTITNESEYYSVSINFENCSKTITVNGIKYIPEEKGEEK